METVLEFLSALRRNNDREWFAQNKEWYLRAQAEFNIIAQKLIDGISGFDPMVRGLALKDCTYRIYRDTRFSHNKEPYKTHMGAYVCPFGKKSGYAGYYLHVEHDEATGTDCFMSAGLYMPDPRVLKSVRYEIAENGDGFEEAVKKAKGFSLDPGNKLKRLPAGFLPGGKYDEYLKLKDIHLFKRFSARSAAQQGLAEYVVGEFSATYPFMSILNRAAEYAFEENTDD